MNTNPDETQLALWLEDELTGVELARVEAWASGHPEQLAAREEVRRWRMLVSEAVPAAEEPPYPDFFNSRVLQSICGSSASGSGQALKHADPGKSRSWSSWFMPLAACAGMAFAFWAGMKSRKVPEYDVAGAPKAIIVEPALYTPQRGVDAEWFASSEASATVIILSGVEAIPDATDFSSTAYLPKANEMDSTAEIPSDPRSGSGS
jgi:hypothetical protein